MGLTLDFVTTGMASPEDYVMTSQPSHGDELSDLSTSQDRSTSIVAVDATELQDDTQDDDFCPSLTPSEAALLTQDDKLRLQCLIQDLRRFKSDTAAEFRVQKASIYPFCLGPPYFPLTKADTLLEMTLSNHSKVKEDTVKVGTVREYLANLVQGKGYEVCTSHTLAPAFLRIFGVDEGFEIRGCFKEFYGRFCGAARKCGDGEAALTTTSKEPEKSSKKKKGRRG